MLRQTSKEGGVSPVVGVILMVAVTVILAAVVGSFVLDLGSNVQANPQAGVTFSESGDADAGDAEVTVQVIAMENADSVNVSYSQETGYEATLTSIGQSVTIGDNDVDTSASETANIDGLADDATITIVGSLDGKQSVIQTYTVG
jgi:flagellin-like protein